MLKQIKDCFDPETIKKLKEAIEIYNANNPEDTIVVDFSGIEEDDLSTKLFKIETEQSIKDKDKVGTFEYSGIAWFHNINYKWLLRHRDNIESFLEQIGGEASEYFKHTDDSEIYRRCHNALLLNNLKVNGHSRIHLTVICQALLGDEEKISKFVKHYYRDIVEAGRYE